MTKSTSTVRHGTPAGWTCGALLRGYMTIDDGKWLKLLREARSLGASWEWLAGKVEDIAREGEVERLNLEAVKQAYGEDYKRALGVISRLLDFGETSETSETMDMAMQFANLYEHVTNEWCNLPPDVVHEIAMDKGLPDDEEFLEWLTRAVRTVEGER